jgi:hypothetical protein
MGSTGEVSKISQVPNAPLALILHVLVNFYSRDPAGNDSSNLVPGAKNVCLGRGSGLLLVSSAYGLGEAKRMNDANNNKPRVNHDRYEFAWTGRIMSIYIIDAVRHRGGGRRRRLFWRVRT